MLLVHRASAQKWVGLVSDLLAVPGSRAFAERGLSVEREVSIGYARFERQEHDRRFHPPTNGSGNRSVLMEFAASPFR
jgi:hypothetical protein